MYANGPVTWEMKMTAKSITFVNQMVKVALLNMNLLVLLEQHGTKKF